MKWKLETRKIEEVHPNVKNPRNMGKRQAQELEVSIRKFGLCQPIVLNTDGRIIGGHQRLQALRALGYDHVDVYIPVIPLTEEEEKELTIRLNKNIGVWDDDLLANHWEPEELLAWGFSMEELQVESVPHQKNPPKKFTLTIHCLNQEQLDEMEGCVIKMVSDFTGSRYKVKVA